MPASLKLNENAKKYKTIWSDWKIYVLMER